MQQWVHIEIVPKERSEICAVAENRDGEGVSGNRQIAKSPIRHLSANHRPGKKANNLHIWQLEPTPPSLDQIAELQYS